MANASTDPRSAGELTLRDWLTLFGAIPLFVLRWPLEFLFLHHQTPLHWRQTLALSFLKAQRSTFPRRILRYLVGRTSTSSAISAWCLQHNLPHRAIPLPIQLTPAAHDHTPPIPSPTLHEITPLPISSSSPPSHAILYLHGGGFVNPLRPAAHMPFILSLSLSRPTNPTIYILSYSLAPNHPYPAQLLQTLTALDYLLTHLSLSPHNILLAGDSAGAQLVGAVLAHLVKPHPYAPPLPLGGEKLGGVLMVSPFTRLPPDTSAADVGGGSYATNAGRDYLTLKQVNEFRDAWRGKERDVWANLCGTEDAAWVWREAVLGREAVVERVLITVGTAEVFLDDCRVFARDYLGAERVVVARGDEVPRLGERVLVECVDEVHVQVALDSVVGYREGVMMRVVREWLRGDAWK